MTNLDYIQQLGKDKGLEYLRGVCPRHPCHNCTLSYDGESCSIFTAGSDELAEWLFAEREEKKKDKRGAGHPVAPIRGACCGNCRWMDNVYGECSCDNLWQSQSYVHEHYICDLFERRGEGK